MEDFFDQVGGLPLHPLVVHFAVVVVPVAALGVIALVLIPALRRNYSLPILLALVVSLPISFVAQQSGEALAERLYEPERHSELGELLPQSVAGMLAIFATWYFVSRKGGPKLLLGGLSVVSVIAATGLIVLTFLIGHSGAEATWGSIPED